MQNRLILMILLFAVASMEVKAFTCGTQWTKTNTSIETLNVATRIADYKQTRHFLKPKHRAQGYYEANPVLGKYPSNPRLINAGIIYSAAVAGIAYCLPRPKRKTWQAFSLIISSVFVLRNHQAGFKVNF